MICCGGKGVDPAQKKVNSAIEKKLKDDRKKLANKIKLLLLGTGDSGKSTFCKQMRILYREGFSKSELEKYVDILRDNCLTGMARLLFACNEWGYTIDIPRQIKDQVDLVLNSTELTEEIADILQKLWTCDFVQKAFERNNELQLPGGSYGTEYYIKHALRFASKDYIPTQEDVIKAKLRTSGINEVNFSVDAVDFTMVDVGGQRSERRKWLGSFVDVSAVIYLVAINEYDMNLEEDNKTNRMEESLKLWTKITGAQWFENTPFILFLNKSDLFAEKIQKTSLRDYFEDYDNFVHELPDNKKDLSDLEKGCAYIQSHFVEAFNGNRLYAYVTCAVDTDNCKKVFKVVRDSLIGLQFDRDNL